MKNLDGRVWAASSDRLYIYEQDSLFFIPDRLGLFKERIIHINQLSNGIMLGVSVLGNGLLMWSGRGDDVVNINKNNGLLSNIIRNIYIDKDQVVWLSTPKGICRLDINSKSEYTNF